MIQEEKKEENKIIFSYRMVMLCSICLVIVVMAITGYKNVSLNNKLKLANSESERLALENKALKAEKNKLKNYIEQLQDWRALLKKNNPQYIKLKMDRDKILRPKNIMFEID